MNKSGIYKITNITNNKCYIGSAVNIRIRWATHKRHLNTNKHHSILLQRAWDKYGEHNFKFEVLLICDKDELIKNEQKQLDWFKPDCNICKIAGSLLGIKHSEEFGKKVSERLKGNTHTLGYKPSKETLLKMSESHKNQKPSDEHKNKISKANKGRKHTEETKEKMRKPKSEQAKLNMSACRINKKQSPETIAKRVKSLTGLKKKPHCEETKRMISDKIKAHWVKLKNRDEVLSFQGCAL